MNALIVVWLFYKPNNNELAHFDSQEELLYSHDISLNGAVISHCFSNGFEIVLQSSKNKVVKITNLVKLQHCKKLFVVSLNSVGLLYTMSYVYKYYSMNNVCPL